MRDLRSSFLRCRSVLALLAVAVAGPVAAQDLRFVVETDMARVQVGQRFVIHCQVQAPGDIDELVIPDLGGLTELGRSRSESSQVRIVNGQLSMSRSVRVELTVVADRPGTYTIGGGRVRVGGRSATSHPLHITAVAGSGAVPPSSPQGTPRPAPGAPASPPPAAHGRFANIFAALSVDRDQVYLGQQITATLTLYSRVDLSDIRGIHLPSLAGVVVEEIDSPRQIQGRRRVLGGRAYQAYLIKRVALFPTRSGLLQIPPATINAVIGGGFFNAGRMTELKSDPVEVDVRALPAQGQPAGFESANVGRFSLQVQVSPRRVKRSDPVTLKVTITGTGNLRAIRPPQIDRADGFRVYPPTPFEQIDVAGGRLRGHKGYEVLLQAQRPGRLQVPALRFVYFDPDRQGYQVVESDPLAIEVIDDGQALQQARGEHTENEAPALQARPLRLQIDTRTASIRPMPPRSFFLSVLALLGALALVLLGDGLRRRRHHSQRGQRRQQLRRAREQVERSTQDSGVDAMAQAMEALIECALGQPVKGLTREGLEQALGQASCDSELRRAVLDFIDASEVQRFAPPGLSAATDLGQGAKALAQQLEAFGQQRLQEGLR